MTQPAPPPQQQQQQQQPSRAQIAATAAALASSVPLAALVAGLAVRFGTTAALVRAVLALIPPTGSGLRRGPAGMQVAGSEAQYRAAYLANALTRVQDRVAGGMSIDDAMTVERRYADQHLAAQANRARAALQVDRAAARHGGVLGWRARMDSRTSAECRAADGKNFRVTARPLIGWPGSVHPHCRCVAVPAFAGAGWVDQTAATAERKVAVA